MDSPVANEHSAMDDSTSPPAVIKKIKRLSNGTVEQDNTEQEYDSKHVSFNSQENGLTCNGTSEQERHNEMAELSHSDNCCLPAEPSNNKIDDTSADVIKVSHSKDSNVNIYNSDIDDTSNAISRTNKDSDKLCNNESNSDVKTEGAFNNDKTDSVYKNSGTMGGVKESSEICDLSNSQDIDNDDADTDRICVIACVTGDASNEDVEFDHEDKPNVHVSESEHDASGCEDFNSGKGKDDESGTKNLCIKEQHNSNKTCTDSEKENINKNDNKVSQALTSGGRSHKKKSQEMRQANKQSYQSELVSDDVEIIGESKVVRVNTPKSSSQTSQNVVFVSNNLSGSKGQVTPSPVNHGQVPTSGMHGLPSGIPGFPFPGGVHPHGAQNMPLMVPSVAPPKPKSSLDQIELIRWEIQNRINTRPKYFKPNSSSELGPLAKFLFDVGSDLIKESVYHELVKIQSKKKGDDKLSEKEKEDLEKLKEIEKDLFATIGHLKLKLKQKCKVCHFQTESHNVMFHHKQYPHEDNKFLRCAHCNFSTKQAVAFKFHLESEHAIQPKLNDKKAFFECDLCPYENNQEQKLTLHKQRCLKQFRPMFNLHPSCLSGAEINLCLENIFYRPVIPKNLKILQQKHAQQQAALFEARKQQAQMQALAAQKNALTVAAKKLQPVIQKAPQVQKAMPQATRTKAAPAVRMPVPQKTPGVPQQQQYNAAAKAPSPAMSAMVKQNAASSQGAAGSTASSGFEVCEICGGYVKDRKALRIHFFYAHRIDLPFNLFERNQAPLYCATCYVRFWTAHGLRKHIDTHKEENQTRGVVGKCISCGHHVLNLLLHMRVVHNREMQHYINALMCMFCGSHFGSHQECERHILKTHGHIDPTTGTLKSAPTASPAQPPPPQKTAPNNKRPAGGNNNLVKGSVCVLCNLNFGRNVDLTRHCMRMHHTCMKCGMVVIDKASLMKHTCLSSPSGTRDCTMCGECGFHPAYYVKHLRDKHLKRFSIRVWKLDKSTIEQWTKRPYQLSQQQVLVEISDSDDEVVPAKPPQQHGPIKKARIGPASKIGRPQENPETLSTPQSDDIAGDGDKSDVQDKPDSVKETTVSTYNDDDNVDSDLPVESTSPGQKRKAEDVPSEDESDSKRQK